MSIFYRAICSDGCQVTATAPESGHSVVPVVTFHANSVQVPVHSVRVSAARVGDDYVALASGVDGQVVRVTSRHSVGTLGQFYSPSTWVDEDGTCYFIDSLKTYTVVRPDGTRISRPVPKSGGQWVAGGGWIQVLDGVPRWSAIDGRTVIDGRLIADPFPVGDWTIGGETKSPGRILAHRGGQWYVVWTKQTPVSPTAALVNGQVIVAIGLNGAFVHEDDFVPVDLSAEPDPVVTVPTFQKTPNAVGIGLFDDLTGPRIIEVGERPSPNVEAVLHTIPQPGDTSRPTLAQSRALADSIGRPCLVYADKHGLAPSQMPSGCRGLLYAYPSAKRALSETLELVTQDCRAFRAARNAPFDIAMALYRQWNPSGYPLSEQQVLDTAAGVWRLAVEYGAGAVWVFSKQRIWGTELVDGVDRFPSFQMALARMKAATPDWQTFPRPASVTPAPRPEPTPRPIPAPIEEPTMPTIDTYTYDEWLELGRKIEARYREVHAGQPPAPTDIQHNTFRLLKEGYSEQRMLDTIDPSF